MKRNQQYSLFPAVEISSFSQQILKHPNVSHVYTDENIIFVEYTDYASQEKNEHNENGVFQNDTVAIYPNESEAIGQCNGDATHSDSPAQNNCAILN